MGFRTDKNGIIFPVFSDFREEMEKEGKIQFGNDFKIEPETSLGQFLEVISYMLENTSKQLQNVYLTFWLFNKNGALLSEYAGNYGIERIQGKYAYGNLNIEGVPGHIVVKGFQVRSKKGLLYQTVSNVLINASGKAIAQIRAMEFGEEYNTEANTILEKATGDENVTKIYNLESVTGGTFLESDEDLRERRNSKQPLNFGSAGSTFKRPEGHFASKLIEDAGLKGYHINDAWVSEKHSGFVVNKGNASYKEVMELIGYVQKVVFEKFGVKLETEVRILKD